MRLRSNHILKISTKDNRSLSCRSSYGLKFLKLCNLNFYSNGLDFITREKQKLMTYNKNNPDHPYTLLESVSGIAANKVSNPLRWKSSQNYTLSIWSDYNDYPESFEDLYGYDMVKDIYVL